MGLCSRFLGGDTVEISEGDERGKKHGKIDVDEQQSTRIALY